MKENGRTYMQIQTVTIPHPLLDIQIQVQTILEPGEFDLERWTSWFQETLMMRLVPDPKWHDASLTYEEYKESLAD